MTDSIDTEVKAVLAHAASVKARREPIAEHDDVMHKALERAFAEAHVKAIRSQPHTIRVFAC